MRKPLGKMNEKMTRGKIEHILAWSSCVRAAGFQWTKNDAKLELFLKIYINTL